MKEYQVTDSAVASLHIKLKTTRNRPILDVAVDLSNKIEAACIDARRKKLVIPVYDTVRGDRNVQLHPIEVDDDGRTTRFIAIVVDNYDGRGGAPRKLVIAILGLIEANKSILHGRWLTPEGEPINGALPGPVDDAPGETTAEVAPMVAAPTPVDVTTPPVIDKAASGSRRGGTPAEREAYVLELLRADPKLKVIGKGGIDEKVRAKFGIGMRHSVVERVRARLAVRAPAPAPTPAPIPVPVRNESDRKLWDVANRLVDALAAMKASEAKVAACMGEIKALVGRS